MEISTLFNGQYPERINIVKGNINDRKCIDNMFVTGGLKKLKHKTYSLLCFSNFLLTSIL